MWSWSFAVEYLGAITLDKLVNDLNGIPMSDKLEYIETKNLKMKNTYFSIDDNR